MPQKRMSAPKTGQSSKLVAKQVPKQVVKTVTNKVAAKAVSSPKSVSVKAGASAKKSAAKPTKLAKVEITASPVGAKSKVSAKIKAKSGDSNTADESLVQAKAALKKEKARGRKISVDIVPGEGASALSGKWATLYKKADQIESQPYNMRNLFEEKTAIVHKVLGWGYILANRNDRLEVLFKDGIKYLISNYKA